MIVCFYSRLHPLTRLALDRRQDVTYRPTDEQRTYGSALAMTLVGAEDVVCIEQDMEVTDSAIDSLLDCDQPWCTWAYQGPPVRGMLYRSLGFVKFSKFLQLACNFSALHKATWNELDTIVSLSLGSGGFTVPHVHGSVKHYHNYMQEFREPGVFCYERQPDNDVWLYRINSDGTRGNLIAGGTGIAIKRELAGFRV